MVDKVFDKLLLKGIRQGHMPARETDARRWYRQKAQDLEKPKQSKLIRKADRERKRDGIVPGAMYFFRYSAKYAAELPYWDKIPLIFPFDETRDHIMGLNMHYLPPQQRAKLMDALYDLATDRKYNESTRLSLSYDILKSASKYRFFKPCVHQYLKKNVKTSFIFVSSTEWDMALFLPLADWQGASAERVWADSRKKAQ